MTLADLRGRRIGGPDWGVRNLEGIGNANDPENRVRVLRLAAAVGVSLGALACIAALANEATGIRIPGYSGMLVVAVAGGGAGLATLVFPFAARLPLWFVHVGAFLVNIALFVAARLAGEVFIFALMSYIVVGTVLAMICRLGPLIAHLAVIAAATAAVLWLQDGTPQAVSGFVVLIGVLVVNAGCAAWLVGRVRVLARREHLALKGTERARADLEVASGHKTAFLANMSHEFRTPLNAIIGFSDVLDEGIAGELTAKQREYVSDIRASGQHLLELINDVLDLAKVEAGRYELDLGLVSIPDALEEWARVVRARAASNGVTITLGSMLGVGTIVADERKVRQVILNLLSNAVKFTPPGGRVTVQARRSESDVEITVQDTGVGIDPSDQERIFDEFIRADRPSGDAEEGTGLGLALARRFVELHGGRIWVDSRPGMGSTFGFTLPVRERAREDSNPQPSA